MGTLIIGRTAAPLLYGDEFRESGDVLSLLGIVLVITSFTILFGTVALATGRQRMWNTVMFAGVLLTIPLDVLFVPWADRVYDNGALGGAITYIIAESLMFALGITLVTPYILERTTLSYFVRIVIAGVVMVVAAWPIRERFLALPVALGIVVFPVAILVLRALPPSEREMLRKVLHRVGLGRMAKP